MTSLDKERGATELRNFETSDTNSNGKGSAVEPQGENKVRPREARASMLQGKTDIRD